MTAPIPVAWPLVVLVFVILGLGVYVLGGEHQRRNSDYRIGWVVRDNRHSATLHRMVFQHLGILMPEMEPEPEPGPTVRQRIARKVTAAGGWVKARFRGPAEVEAVDVFDGEGGLGAAPEPSPFRPMETRDCRCDDGLEPHVHSVHIDTFEPGPGPDKLAWLRVPVLPDPGPDTDEMPALPGPVTQPANVIIDDEWKRESDARFQQMLAEIRGETVKEGL